MSKENSKAFARVKESEEIYPESISKCYNRVL
jgi:hypothetical protein